MTTLPNKDGIMRPILEALQEQSFTGPKAMVRHFSALYGAAQHETAVLLDWAMMNLKVSRFIDHEAGQIRLTTVGKNFLENHDGAITMKTLVNVPAFAGYFMKL